jgi:hydrogenase maturation protease
VLGIGNLLMGDEGVGVHAAWALERAFDTPPAGVAPDVWAARRPAVLDGGTGGFHLLEYLTDYDPVILIDATMDGRPAGTVSVLQPRYASEFPRALTAHDIGLRDLVESALLVRGLPRTWLVTVSIDDIQPMTDTLSPAVHASLPRLIATVTGLVAAEALSA